ncbi:MAG TPA: hypothetical protein VF789_21125 [Thermoanaerobaculia bacterium]
MSWLVRCWEEPREGEHETPVYRCSVRDLRSGEERYLNDPREIGELMLRQVRAERKAVPLPADDELCQSS